MTTAYHPQTNGIDERFNGTLMRVLRCYCNENQLDWDQRLGWSLFLYNTTVHESTGYSPYQVIFGSDPRSPLNQDGRANQPTKTRDDIRAQVRERIRMAQADQKKYYDRHRSEPKLQIGQFVAVKRHTAPPGLRRKLCPKCSGPYIILRLIEADGRPSAVIVLDLESLEKRTVSIQDVKPYYMRGANEPSREDGLIEDPTEDLLIRSLIARDGPVVYPDVGDASAPNCDETTPKNLGPHPITSTPRRVRISDSVERAQFEHDASPIAFQDSLSSQRNVRVSPSELPGVSSVASKGPKRQSRIPVLVQRPSAETASRNDLSSSDELLRSFRK